MANNPGNRLGGSAKGEHGSQGTETRQHGQETGSLTEKAKDVASSAAGTAQDLSRRAGEMASNLGQKAEDAVSGVGGQMHSLAGTIRENAPNQGWMGSAASSVADSLDASGRYLEGHDLSEISDDLIGVIRRYPLQAVLIGIGVGFLVARATRS
jgi:hypothetical protein